MNGRRCQIREADKPEEDSGLVYHIANADGLPACGTQVRPWKGREMRSFAFPTGEITCARCKP